MGKMTIPGNGFSKRVMAKAQPEMSKLFLKVNRVSSIKKTAIGSGKIVLE